MRKAQRSDSNSSIKSNSSHVLLALIVGGAIIGNMIIPGVGGAVAGGVVGGLVSTIDSDKSGQNHH